MDSLYELLSRILGGIPNIIMAILLAILAWIIASIVRKIIVKLGGKLKLPAYFEKMHIVPNEEKGNDLLKTLGNLGFFIVFLIMIPAVFDALGMESVSAPISGMVSAGLAFLPNILGAILILFIGYLLAKIAKEVVAGLAKALGLDKLSNKLNPDSAGEYALSALLGNIVFALIIIPTAIIALQILKLHAVADPAISMLKSIFDAVPNIIVFVIMILLGVFIAKIVGNIAKGFFVTAGVDKLSEHKDFKVLFSKYAPSAIFTGIIRVVIIAIFVFQAVSVLHLDILTNISNALLMYAPNVIGAVLILVVAYFAATYISGFVFNMSDSKFLAGSTKAIIYLFALFMTLNQLALAPKIVLIAFMFILGAVSLAFILAFGIGGKDFAKKQLEKFGKKLDQ